MNKEIPDTKIQENSTFGNQPDKCKIPGGRTDRYDEDFRFANVPNQRKPDENQSKTQK